MRKSAALFVFLAFFGPLRASHAQLRSEITLPPNGDNERAEVSQWIGLVKISIDYHSPNVHGGGGADRTDHIWGELIHYGLFDDGYGPSHTTPWRAGANESTTITFSHDVKIDRKDLKAGTYALFLELQKDQPWVWIFSTNSAGWGSYQYDPKYDALRVPANPQAAPYTEFLTYGFDERRTNSAVAYLQWEKKRISFKVEVPNINELYVDQIRKDLQSWPGFNFQNWRAAAQFCVINKINLEEALVWADKALNEPFRGIPKTGPADFLTLRTKAAILEALKHDGEAEAVMTQALALPDTDVSILHAYGSGLLRRGKKEEALEVFKLNQQRHPSEKFWTYLGLASAYTALGDNPSAIKNWEIALENVPPTSQSDIPTYEATLKKLKESK